MVIERSNVNNEFVRVLSQRGCFNLFNPSHETVSTHIQVCKISLDGGLQIVKHCNIETQYELDPVFDLDVNMLIGEINLYRNRVWSTRDKEIKEMRDYLVKNKSKLEYGNIIWDYNSKKKSMEKIQKSLVTLESDIRNYEESNSKFVNGAFIYKG